MRLPRDSAKSTKEWNSVNALPTTEKAIVAAENFAIWTATMEGGLLIDQRIGNFNVTVEIDADGELSTVCWGK